MERYLTAQVKRDLKRKMVFVCGPRQCGKTTLAEQVLGTANPERFLNYDVEEDRERILKRLLPTEPGLIVLDEIHKYAGWRNYLKGLYDKKHGTFQILVTGSARLDLLRKAGDSLQGRYHLLRLHPLSYQELCSVGGNASLGDLMNLGGFPEPFLSGSEREARRWSREYRTRVIRQELTQLERINELSRVEELSLALPDRVGSPLSINSLREDLQISHQTASRWIGYLENLFQIFRIYPFGVPRLRAVKKEAKHYHFDWTLIQNEGLRFENLVACHLLKWCHFIEDTEGFDMELRYFRNVDGKEVDFVVLKDRKPQMFIECKLTEKTANPALRYLSERFPKVRAIQIHLENRHDVTDSNGIRICHAKDFLRELV